MQYRKKSALVEAVGLPPKGEVPDEHLLRFIGRPGSNLISFDPESGARIVTPDGIERSRPGDWIIRSEGGPLYSCRNDLFRALYERAD